MPTAAFVYADALSQHVLRDDHPMKPHRLRMVYELLDAYGVFARPEAVVLAPHQRVALPSAKRPVRMHSSAKARLESTDPTNSTLRSFSR